MSFDVLKYKKKHLMGLSMLFKKTKFFSNDYNDKDLTTENSLVDILSV